MPAVTGTQNVVNAIRNDILGVKAFAEGIANLGHFQGSFNTYASLPANQSYFTGLTVNDFITIKADETKGGMTTRYVCQAINSATGAITWTYDLTYSTDISGKVDKITAGSGNRVYSHNAATQSDLAIDSTPTSASTNLITSGGAYTALSNKVDKVPAAPVGNLAMFDDPGNVINAGLSIGIYANASAAQTASTANTTKLCFFPA